MRSQSAPHTKAEKQHRRSYSREEIVDALKQVWAALDGDCGQIKVNAYAKKHGTPTYPTFVRNLGPREKWAAIVDGGKTGCDKFAEQGKTMEQPSLPQDIKTEAVEPPMSTERSAIEIKISVPGLDSPIVINIAIK